MQQHIRSYYAASAHPAPLREPLRGEVTADVCVVGGGIAGCSTALNLAERGYKVVLLEGKRIAWGASGRSGGQAIFGFAAGQDKLIAQVGRENAKRMFDISVEALDLLKERVARHAIDCDLNWGQMHVAIKPRHETELQAWREELARDYGYTPDDFYEFIEVAPSALTELVYWQQKGFALITPQVMEKRVNIEDIR